MTTGSALRHDERKPSASLLGWALRGLACGIVLGILIGTGTAPTTAAVMGLGFVVLAGLFLSFGSERPTDP